MKQQLVSPIGQWPSTLDACIPYSHRVICDPRKMIGNGPSFVPYIYLSRKSIMPCVLNVDNYIQRNYWDWVMLWCFYCSLILLDNDLQHGKWCAKIGKIKSVPDYFKRWPKVLPKWFEKAGVNMFDIFVNINLFLLLLTGWLYTAKASCCHECCC